MNQPKGYSAPVAFLLLVAAASAFASNGVAARFATVVVPAPPATLSLWRWIVVVALLTPFVIKGVIRHRATIMRELPVIFGFGATGMVLASSLLYLAGQTTPAINIIFFYALSPALIAFGARLSIGEPTGLKQIAGMLLALFGVLYIVTAGHIESMLQLALGKGDIYCLISMASWSTYAVSVGRWPSKLPPLVRMWAISVAGIICLLPFVLWEMSQGLHMEATPNIILMVLFIGIVPTLFGFLLHSHLAKRIGAARAGLVGYISPISGALLAWAVIGEKLYFFHLIGAAAALGGVWLATQPVKRRA